MKKNNEKTLVDKEKLGQTLSETGDLRLKPATPRFRNESRHATIVLCYKLEMKKKMLTDLQSRILQMLRETEGSYGLEMVKNSGGQLKRGSVYVLLERLESQRLIRSKLEKPENGSQGPARRKYELTGEGLRQLEFKIEQQMQLFGLAY